MARVRYLLRKTKYVVTRFLGDVDTLILPFVIYVHMIEIARIWHISIATYIMSSLQLGGRSQTTLTRRGTLGGTGIVNSKLICPSIIKEFLRKCHLGR